VAGAIVTAASDLKSGVTKYEVTWVSDASGNVSGSVFAMKMGTIIAVEFVPGPGALAPTDLYDVDLLDAEGVSMFDDGAGTTIGANLSSVVASHKVPMVGLVGVTIYRRWHHGGDAQLTVANAGDSNAGTANIFVAQGVI
jgi:hypothetical protein